ncbi:MAG: hypothetical protein ACKVTZ_18930 [Bacteroidia bacterium]
MKRKTFIFTLLYIAHTALFGQQPDVYDEKVTAAANVCTTISNLGIIGNAFNGSYDVLGYPSAEYPCGSGIEHIFEGGLWIGGVIDGQTLVTTGAVDDASGYITGKAGFEFTSKKGLNEASSLVTSAVYNPSATSHQDLTSSFTDTSAFVISSSGGQIPIQNHIPLGLKVDFAAYNWNYSFANFFVILNYRITNVSSKPIDSVFVGYWVDGVIRNVNITPPGGSAFFNKSGNGYLDSLTMGYEFDATGDVGYTDSYVGTKFLGAELNGLPNPNPNFAALYNTWQFQNSSDPLYFFPTTDIQRYGKLTTGLNTRSDWSSTIENSIKSANNRSNLISAGPFTRLNPGEYIDVAYSIVFAKRVLDGNPAAANTDAQLANLIQNAKWAQTAYHGEDKNKNGILDDGEDKDGNGKITRFVLPSPPEIPKTKIVAKDKSIEVYWAGNSENSVDPISNQKDFAGFRLYKTAVGFDVQNTTDIFNSLKLIGEWDIKGDKTGYETGLEAIQMAQPITFEGDTTKYRYKYVFDNILNGWQHIVAVTAFDKGDKVNNLESLESASLSNLFHVFAGKPANPKFENGEPFAYPNPYYINALWEGNSQFAEDKKLIFANLPQHCEVKVYTLSGDLIDSFEHDSNYKGGDIRWYETYSNSEKSVFSGGEHAWDLLSQNSQIISRGLYLFTVKDLDNNKMFRGKFVVIK